jgi:hypothetical protein
MANMTHMSDALPWNDYSKGPLRSGMSYPVRRNLIERLLREADVTIEGLEFSGGTNEPVSTEDQDIIQIFWYGKYRSRGLANGSLAPSEALFMRVQAVDSAHRHEVSVLLEEALPTVCQWIAAALAREPASVWSASNHELTVRYSNHAIAIHKQ